MQANLSGRRLVLAAALLSLLAATGCRRGASVSGKVTFKGQPVPGAISFYGPGGRVDSGRIDEEGKYTVAKAPIGDVKVTVAPAELRPAKEGADKGKKVPEHPGSGKAPPPPKAGKSVDIPSKYKDPEKSGLTYTLKSGQNQIDIDLKP